MKITLEYDAAAKHAYYLAVAKNKLTGRIVLAESVTRLGALKSAAAMLLKLNTDNLGG